MSKPILEDKHVVVSEAASVFLIGLAAFSALLFRNSFLSQTYLYCLNTALSLKWLGLDASPSLYTLVNEALVVFFFALVSLEIKKEVLVGSLRNLSYALLPCISALSGILVPAGLYCFLNWQYPALIGGWAIPTATDIAFSLSLLSVLGGRVPIAMRLFLSTLAIVDDLCAVIIIAAVYTIDLSWPWVSSGVIFTAVLYILNQKGAQSILLYGLLGLLLWWSLLQSGIHPTIAGVLWATCLPLESPKGSLKEGLLHRVELCLRPLVNYGVLPIFALVNAGVPLSALSLADLNHPLFMGVFLGLLVGKPLGILLGSGFVLATGAASWPVGMHWRHLLSLAFLGGIGFTMSLLIANLTFFDEPLLTLVRQGILGGSLCSALLAFFTFPKASACNFGNRR